MRNEPSAKPKSGLIIGEFPEAINGNPPRESVIKHPWGNYVNCAQLIEFEPSEPGEEPSLQIRLGYYRQRPGEENRWEFAAQTTITDSPKEIRQFLDRIPRHWFKKAH